MCACCFSFADCKFEEASGPKGTEPSGQGQTGWFFFPQQKTLFHSATHVGCVVIDLSAEG